MSGAHWLVADDARTSAQAAAVRAAAPPGSPPLRTLQLRTGAPAPPGDHTLDLSAATAASPLAAAAARVPALLEALAPATVITAGDTAASLAVALMAVERGIPALRLDAGRRTFDRRGIGPEAARVLQDHLAARCLPYSERARRTLLREGMPPWRAPLAGTAGGEMDAAQVHRELRRFREAPALPVWHPLGAAPATAADNGFTLARYRALLAEMRDAGYVLSSFPEAIGAPAAGPRLLLRHDLDLSLDDAVPMAELEADLGVTATYFFLLRTEHYNVLSARGSAQVSRILQLGHRPGLHLDLAAYGDAAGPADLAAGCRREAALFAEWFARPVDAVSLHRPSPQALAAATSLAAPLPHTAMPRFTQEMKYLSDSRGHWREGPPTEHPAFHDRRPIQLLVHPVWWHDQPAAPLDALLQLADRMRESLEISIARNNLVYRVGWLAEKLGTSR